MTRPVEMEIFVDSFAGGGGASEGMRLALGRGPDIAINHDAEALALHAANHPESQHFQEDVWKVDPVTACAGRPVGLMWLSPDCKHFSKAKGGKPVSKRVRGLAWVAVRWAKAVAPRIIVLENVEEFQTWGPVDRETMRPDPTRRGLTFKKFVGRLRGLGYVVEWRELRACDFGAPTIRKRLFPIARRDGRSIVWPPPTHGKGRAQPWRTAAECIDFGLDCPSIFARKKPLADNTLKRIGAGLRRFVFEADRPFIVEYHAAKRPGDDRVRPLSLPLPVQSTENRFGLVTPHLVEIQNSNWGGAPISLEDPMRTITAYPKGGGHALVAGFLAKHYGERSPNEVQGASLFGQAPTVTSIDHTALVTSSLVSLRGTSPSHLHGDSVEQPMRTVAAGGLHTAEVRAFLVAYYGAEKDGGSLFDPMRTLSTRDRFGLVTVDGTEYQLADIGMRMLQPRELYRAQGFRDSYRIDIEFNGKPLSKTAQVRMCGNSVVPQVAAAILAANVDVAGVEVSAA